jgi:hypothetical protein
MPLRVANLAWFHAAGFPSPPVTVSLVSARLAEFIDAF